MHARKRILFLIFLLSVLGLTFASCSERSSQAQGADSAGQGARPISNNPDIDKNGRITLVELGAKDCPPCRAMEPVRKKLMADLGDSINFVYYDVWTNEGAPHGQRYRARVIPTQVFLDAEGREFFRHEGYFAEAQIRAVFKRMGLQ